MFFEFGEFGLGGGEVVEAGFVAFGDAGAAAGSRVSEGWLTE